MVTDKNQPKPFYKFIRFFEEYKNLCRKHGVYIDINGEGKESLMLNFSSTEDELNANFKQLEKSIPTFWGEK